MNKIIHGDCLDELKKLEDNSVDLVCTDPPYGYSFMGKNWDKAVPSVEIWKECLRVLKPGGFAFVMSAPRQDVLSQMIVRIGEAGFNTNFTSLYWTYASGFPKAANIGKMVDKRGGVSVGWFGEWLRNWRKENNVNQKEVATLFPSKTGGLTGCVANWELGLNVPTPEQFSTICRHFNLPFESIEAAEREVIGKQKYTVPKEVYQIGKEKEGIRSESLITTASTDQAKALDGSYGGFQPKPAVEVIIVAMKPLSEKTFVDQALKNGKGVTWLEDCKIPVGADTSLSEKNPHTKRENSREYTEIYGEFQKSEYEIPTGRFPANLLVSDDVLNDGVERRARGNITPDKAKHTHWGKGEYKWEATNGGDTGSYSRYFSLDAWAQNLPFLQVPKASKSEKNRGLEGMIEKVKPLMGEFKSNPGRETPKSSPQPRANFHPTVKPLTLMSYLVTLGSREGDTVLEPFAGSGTTCIAAKKLNRQYIGIEREAEYVEIAKARLEAVQPTLSV